MIRGAYVRAIRAAGRAAERSGLDSWLEQRRGRVASHIRSLVAIYDVSQMIDWDAPWWTYRAASRVDNFLKDRENGARVFEFGSGASTVWLAKRAGEVVSVEHDRDFAAKLEPLLKGCGNVSLHCVQAFPRGPASTAVSGRRGHVDLDFGDYVNAITEVGGLFDLIVIDGRARPACLDRSVSHLSDDGLIVFDNANRARNRRALQRSGFVVEYLRGFAPALPYPTVTALLRRSP